MVTMRTATVATVTVMDPTATSVTVSLFPTVRKSVVNIIPLFWLVVTELMLYL
jgi:hypothetical protein